MDIDEDKLKRLEELRDDDLLDDMREEFERIADAESENRQTALEDLTFSRLGDQWPDDVVTQRNQQGRPMLTINKMPSFIRQVVNDSRMNKSQIKVRPVDQDADSDTAEIFSGLIRNIENTSNADIAYDTAIECAVSCGFGYIRIGLDYAHSDAFDQDINIKRVINPFSVYGDPDATSADGSDWNVAFVTDRMRKKEYAKKYRGMDDVDFESDEWSSLSDHWQTDDTVLIAEGWRREELEREIIRLDNGDVWAVEDIEQNEHMQLALQIGTVKETGRRMSKYFKVTQVIMSGQDILERREWAGQYIPIVPVYGDEFTVEDKRYFRSLIHNAKDPQKMLNYWRTSSTELVALAPKVPWIGRKGTFDSDAQRWATANTAAHSYLEYDTEPPTRQPLDSGNAAGSLQEAMNANDDMNAIMGVQDRAPQNGMNPISGQGIHNQQKKEDLSNFHFIDNLSRSIRHLGHIIVDLVPHVYNQPRVIRVLGEDGAEDSVKINQQFPKKDPQTGRPMTKQVKKPLMDPFGNPVVDTNGQPVTEVIEEEILAIYDLTTGKYDVTCEAGPSFATRRQEAAYQMTELMRTFPESAKVIGDLVAKALDWPNSEEIAKRLEALNPAVQKQLPPEVMQQLQQIPVMQQAIDALMQENKKVRDDKTIDMIKAQTDQFEADTDRIKTNAEIAREAVYPTTPPPNFAPPPAPPPQGPPPGRPLGPPFRQ